MYLALGAIGSLFFVFLVALLLVRAQAPVWPPAGVSMPPGLWGSTLLMLLSSLALHSAQTHARAGRQEPVAGRLALASGLGLLFLAVQLVIWASLWSRGRLPSSDLYAGLFYTSTALHGVHVLGGVVLLVRIAWRARKRTVSHTTLSLMALYWHFMGLLWLIVFALLWGPS